MEQRDGAVVWLLVVPRELSSHRRVQRFDQVLPMRGHLLLDGHAGRQIDRVEIEADPAVVVAFAQNLIRAGKSTPPAPKD